MIAGSWSLAFPNIHASKEECALRYNHGLKEEAYGII
jgi:hypothetical protein